MTLFIELDESATDYQREVIGSTSQNRIMIGGRQTGKTDTIIREVAGRVKNGEKVVVDAQYERMAKSVWESIASILPDSTANKQPYEILYGDGRAVVMSDTALQQFINMPMGGRLLRNVSLICIDEAEYSSEEMLFELERMDVDVLLTETPIPTVRTIIDVWAESSPYWDAVRVPSDDAPFIDEDNLERFRESMNETQAKFELDAAYTREERR